VEIEHELQRMSLVQTAKSGSRVFERDNIERRTQQAIFFNALPSWFASAEVFTRAESAGSDSCREEATSKTESTDW